MPRAPNHGAMYLCSIATLLCLASPAHADSETHYQDYLVGEGAAGMGGAHTALAHEASGAHYNPAGILRPGAALLQLSMSAYKLRMLTMEAADVCGHLLEDSEQSFFSFPGSLGIVLPFSAGGLDHAIGFTLVVPHWDRSKKDFQVKGARCGQLSISAIGSELQVDRVFSAGITYAIRPMSKLQLGLTVGTKVRTFTTSSLVSIVTDSQNLYPAILHLNGEVTMLNLFIQAGAIYEPLPGLRLGLSFTSPQIRLTGRGRLDIISTSADPTDVAGEPVLVAEDAEYYWKVPFKLTLGAAYAYRHLLTVALDVSLHGPQGNYRLAEHPKLDKHTDADSVPRVERDVVVNVNLGLEAMVWRKLILRLGLFTNFTSFPDEADVPLQDRAGDFNHTDMFGATLGASYLSSASSILSFGVQGQLGDARGISTHIYSKDGTTAGLTEENAEVNALDFALIVTVGGSYDIR